MNDRQKLIGISALALVGLFDAVWLAVQSLVTSARSMCGPVGDCAGVLTSPFAQVGGIPVSLFGAAMYGVILLLAVQVAANPEGARWGKSLKLLAVTGACISAGFMIIQVFVLRSFCLFCTISAVTIMFIAAITLTLGRREKAGSGLRTGGLPIMWACIALVAVVFFWALGSGVSGPATVVGRIGNEVLREARMKRELAVFTAENERLLHEMKIAWVTNTLTERMLQKEAERRKVAVESLAAEVMRGPVAVSDSEHAAAVTALLGPGAQLTEAEREQVHSMLLRQKQEALLARYVDSLRHVYGMEVFLEPMPVVNPLLDFTGSPSFGPKGAPAAFVVFTDFQCPYCASVAGAIDELFRRNPGRITVTIKNYPLAIHPRASRAAEAALCANDQGKFKSYHDRLFAGQGALDDAALLRIAAETGCDTTSFGACLRSGRHGQFIRRDIEEAERIGVTGTPTVFLNGRPLLGELTLERLQSELDLIVP